MRKFLFDKIKLTSKKNFISTTQNKSPIMISHRAWEKMATVLNNNTKFAFLFSAKSGGCNGFNYNLQTMNKAQFEILMKNSPTPICVNEGNAKLVIDPSSELLLIGSTIGYVEENYEKNIFENKFIFGHPRELANSCGCGVSFSPK